jgi:very-short-patch-repair endonuclease
MFTKHINKPRSNQSQALCNQSQARCNQPSPCGRVEIVRQFRGGGFIDYQKFIFSKKLQFAKNLRHNQTDAEGLLWYYIRSKQLGGFRFKRQQIIGKYIVDFVCFEKKLIIELDGSQHGEIDIIKSDKIRDDFLKFRGFKILRFWNEEIFKNCYEVLDFIYYQLRR